MTRSITEQSVLRKAKDISKQQKFKGFWFGDKRGGLFVGLFYFFLEVASNFPEFVQISRLSKSMPIHRIFSKQSIVNEIPVFFYTQICVLKIWEKDFPCHFPWARKGGELQGVVISILLKQICFPHYTQHFCLFIHVLPSAPSPQFCFPSLLLLFSLFPIKFPLISPPVSHLRS